MELESNWTNACSFWQPKLFTENSAWREHAPFAFWLVSVLQPRTIVELGTHHGYSYFVFCQAVRALGLSTRCYAIDTWKGDEHAGFYSDEVYREVSTYNEDNYSSFSVLIRSTFSDALPLFADSSIDLLHVDGRHYYEDVRNDYESWRDKLTDRSVVLFHDTAVRERGFGVYKLWAELLGDRPGFEFVHCHGLGVLGYGANLPPAVASLLQSMGDVEALSTMRDTYARLGAMITAEKRIGDIEKQRRTEVNKLSAQLHTLQAEISTLSAAAQASQSALSKATMALRRHAKAKVDRKAKNDAMREAHRKRKTRIQRLTERLKEQESLRWWLSRPGRSLGRLVARMTRPRDAGKQRKLAHPSLAAPDAERASKRREKTARAGATLPRTERRAAEKRKGKQRGKGPNPKKKGKGRKSELTRPPAFEASVALSDAAASSAALVIPFGALGDPAVQPMLTCAVHLHLFYIEMLDEFVATLGNFYFPFDLFVSIAHEEDADIISQRLRSGAPFIRKLVVKAVDNRGRDLKPFLCDFGPMLVAYDLVCHIHSKKSPHNRRKSDWRRQLLHNILGSPKTIAEIIGLFEKQETLGLVFPDYHPELATQIGWGGNRNLALQLARRMSLAELPAQVTLFPAGSMFWARSRAISRLVEVLTADDFPDEDGQIDGTLAHAIERMLGEVVIQSGCSVLQVAAEIPHSSANVYATHRAYDYPEESKVAENILRYRQERGSENRIVIFTAIAGGYEDLIIPEYLDPRFDYVCFVDRSQNDLGVYDIRPIQYYTSDPVRSARFVKTHAHELLTKYDVAIWIDANVLVKSDLFALVERVLESGRPFGAIAHPLRSSVYEEAEECKRADKDSPAIIDKQIDRYRTEGMPAEAGLIESNLMVWNLRHPSAKRILDLWWREIDNGSRRDQLSLPYVLWRLGETWYSLLAENHSLRDHPGFAFFRHGAQADRPILNPVVVPQRFVNPLVPARSYKAVKEERLRSAADRTIDIVVCVHNALPYVVKCLESVERTTRPADRLVIVDDGSESATEQYLREFALRRSNTVLHRNPVAGGYTRAANIGMSLSTAEVVVLLNSDTIVAGDWQLKLADALFATPGGGIAGPMSNAASYQSIPDHLGTPDQTAVNQLPPGVDVATMDAYCEEWSSADALPLVPIIHGFCLAVRREVLELDRAVRREVVPSRIRRGERLLLPRHGRGLRSGRRDTHLCFPCQDQKL